MDNPLQQFIKRFTEEELIPEEKIVKKGKQYYYVPTHIQELTVKAKEEPSMQGMMLGKEHKGIFHASQHLIELLAKNAKNTITLNEKAEWLFVCGRDVFAQNITTKNITDQKALLIVKGPQGDVLGLAKYRREKGADMYKNITDIGNRLRREQ